MHQIIGGVGGVVDGGPFARGAASQGEQVAGQGREGRFLSAGRIQPGGMVAAVAHFVNDGHAVRRGPCTF